MEEHGWKVRLDHVFPEKWTQNLRPTFRQLLDLLPMVLRALPQQAIKLWSGRKPVIDFLSPTTGRNIYGVPLGGIGCGSIGRGFKGEFCRYQLRPGLYEYRTVHANQFILNVQDREGRRTLYQQVLSPVGKPERHLTAWKWGFPGHRGTYRGLYPRSWTDYEIPEQRLRLQCRQVSPVIPHDYQDSSLPVAVFVWTVENFGDEARNVSITFTFKNGNGTSEDSKGGCWCEAFDEGPAAGNVLVQDIGGDRCVYGVAGLRKDDVEVSRLLTFDPCSDGGGLWAALEAAGHLDPPEAAGGRSDPTGKGRQLATAVCVRALVPGGGGRRVLEVALAWDMPVVHFAGRRRQYRRFYTRFFGDGGGAAPSLCAHALRSYGRWEAEIEAWQGEVLQDPDLPAWYKSALFNELYFVSDGGSVWLDEDAGGGEAGLFAYLEGHEYRMYNTYDVHFYASFALVQLWPRLQLSVQRQALRAFSREDAAPRRHLYAGEVAPRKVGDSMAHDVGDPEEDPFLLVNAYPIHDVSEWRDLNLKFVLQTFRDHRLVGDEALGFLREAWPTVKVIVAKGLRWDLDGDGLIENSGGPDQTFDTWVMTGPSAYCGGLWVAALYCAAQMAATVGDAEAHAEYRRLLGRARRALQDKLWNGEYYNFDSTSDSIMADQLCGHWYLRASGVTEEVFPRDNVLSALRKIYDFNVLRFCEGRLGAVNGMLPSGAVDRATLQSEEVWTGVTYALAALLVHEGLEAEGFAAAEGVYRAVWERMGQAYETPEALLARGGAYRSVGYMRPLSVWAVQLAWRGRRRPSVG